MCALGGVFCIPSASEGWLCCCRHWALPLHTATEAASRLSLGLGLAGLRVLPVFPCTNAWSKLFCHPCRIQLLLSHSLSWELLQDVWYPWPLCSLLWQRFYFPSHTAAGGRCWFMPVTYPVLEPRGSQGELSYCNRYLSRPQWSEWGCLHQQGIFPQEFKVLWYAWIYQDIWLLKLVYDRQYKCGHFISEQCWFSVGHMFSHNTEVHFKNTLFRRLSLMTVFPHISIRQQHMPAFLP